MLEGNEKDFSVIITNSLLIFMAIPYVLCIGEWTGLYTIHSSISFLAEALKPVKLELTFFIITVVAVNRPVPAQSCKINFEFLLVMLGILFLVNIFLFLFLLAFSDYSFVILLKYIYFPKIISITVLTAYLSTLSLPFLIYQSITSRLFLLQNRHRRRTPKNIIVGIVLLTFSTITLLFAISDIIDWKIYSGKKELQYYVDIVRVYLVSKEILFASISYLLFFKFCHNILSSTAWIILTFSLSLLIGALMVYPFGVWTISGIFMNVWWAVMVFSFTALVGYANGTRKESKAG